VTIEFRCGHCEKSLKTSIEKAGWQAKCPGCGRLIEIPSSGQAADPWLEQSRPVTSESRRMKPGEVPVEEFKQCHVCSAEILNSAVRCHYCGEVFASDTDRPVPRSGRRELKPFAPGEVIADAWRIFSDRMGFLIGSFFVIWLLTFISVWIASAPFALAQVFIDQDELVGAVLATIVGAAGYFVAMAIATYLQAGYLQLQLKVSREQPASLSDLFNGGPFLVRMILSTLVFVSIVGLGAMMCLIPGLVIALIIWPYAHILVDHNPLGFDCLIRARKLTEGNLGSLLIVVVVAGMSILAGVCTCGIGLAIAIPYVNLLFTVAYDRMSCQTERDSLEFP
jgi:phage FluMu protein Com